jgi:hypothetical protein
MIARIEAMFSLLHTLINTTFASTVSINKSTLTRVFTFLQVMHKKVDMFKLQNKILSDELSLLQHKHCDFIHLQHNPLFGLHIDEQNDIKDENGFNEDTQLTDDDTHKHEDELDEVHMTIADKCEEVIRIVLPWEELQLKQN